MEILTNIPFELDLEALRTQVHLQPGTEDAAAFASLLDEARRVARPKALYKESYIEAKGEDTVTIDGATFTSRALRQNLDPVDRVFPYVATCGREVGQIELPPGDFLRSYWLDVIMLALVRASIRHLTETIDRRYALAKSASMSPGSGDFNVWPIQQQRPLFSLLGDVAGMIGVELTPSFLMIPAKSVSGIRFPTERDFRTCQLCHRENCPNRSAPFDRQAWEATQRPAGAA